MSEQVYSDYVYISVLLRIKIIFLLQLRNTVRPRGRAVFSPLITLKKQYSINISKHNDFIERRFPLQYTEEV